MTDETEELEPGKRTFVNNFGWDIEVSGTDIHDLVSKIDAAFVQIIGGEEQRPRWWSNFDIMVTPDSDGRWSGRVQGRIGLKDDEIPSEEKPKKAPPIPNRAQRRSGGKKHH